MSQYEQHTNNDKLLEINSKIKETQKSMFETVIYELYSPEELKDLAIPECTLNTSNILELYKPTYKGSGISLIDENKFYGTEGRELCPTCNLQGYSCTGHFGIIELPFTVVNPIYMEVVVNILNTVCCLCGRMKTDQSKDYNLSFLKRLQKGQKLEYLSNICSNYQFCKLCSIKFKNPCSNIISSFGKKSKSIKFYKTKIKDKPKTDQSSQQFKQKDGYLKIVASYNRKEGSYYVNYDSIKSIFKKISSEDAKLMGLGENRPENLLTDNLLIIPPKARPECVDGSAVYLEALSKTYGKVIDKLYFYAKKTGENPETLNYTFDFTSEYTGVESEEEEQATSSTLAEQLKNHINLTDEEIYQIFDFIFINDIPKFREGILKAIDRLFIGQPADPDSIGEKGLLSFQTKLDGKFGFLRRQLLGKRVNYTARTVVGPAPNFKVNELGVPKIVADNMPIRFTVTNINYNTVQDMYKQGKIIAIIKKVRNYENRILVDKNKPIKIQVGDVVERTLQDGDYVLANRNPTIHKYNMLGLRAKIIKEPIFRLNLAMTTGFNADFDGDEINIHVPQTVEAQAEMATFVDGEQCYKDIQSSKMMAGLVFDGITGAYILTQDWTFITPSMYDIVLTNADFPTKYLKEYKKYIPYNNIKNPAKKIHSSIGISYNQLMIHVPALKDFEISIINTVEEFHNRIRSIDPDSDDLDNEIDLQFADTNYINNTFLLSKKFITSQDNEILGQLTTIILIDSVLNLKLTLSKNELIYIRLFAEKIGFYYKLLFDNINLGIITDTTDTEDSFFDDCIKNNIDIFSGKSLFSLVIPVRLNYEKAKSGSTPLETYNNHIKINDGILYQGILNKDHVGNSTNSITHVLGLYKDSSAVTFFLTMSQRLINEWFYLTGFSLSFQNCQLTPETSEDIEKQIALIRNEAYELEQLPSDLGSIKEEKIITKIQQIRLLNERVIKELDISNPLLIMAELAKAKGKGANLVQIAASIGQQYYGGERIPNQLPYFDRNEPDPISKGLVVSSFCKGMTPSEFVFHMYSSREGLVESVNKVGECGYLHIQIAKMMEVLNINYDSTIRDAKKRIVEFVYGEDNLDASEITKIKLPDKYDYYSFIDVQFIANQFNNMNGSYVVNYEPDIYYRFTD